MTIKQISVFMENKPGIMVSVTEALGKASIDIRALSLADTQDFGILRMIVDDTEKAKTALSEIGCMSYVTDVIAAVVPDEPGAMTDILLKVAETGLNIEYMYGLSIDGDEASVVLKTSNLVKADEVLSQNGVKTLSHEDIV